MDLDLWIYHKNQVPQLEDSFPGLQRAIERAQTVGLNLRKLVIWDDGSGPDQGVHLESWWNKEKAVWAPGLVLRRQVLSKGRDRMITEAKMDQPQVLVAMDASLKVMESAFHVLGKQLQKNPDQPNIRWVPTQVDETRPVDWALNPELYISPEIQIFSGKNYENIFEAKSLVDFWVLPVQKPVRSNMPTRWFKSLF